MLTSAEAEKHDNVYLHFEHKLRNFDVRKNELKFEKCVAPPARVRTPTRLTPHALVR